MDLFLKAIESSNGFEDSDDELETQNEPTLSFAVRAPQWCIVDKWFTMQVNCSDKNISELEAFVYNSEGHVVQDVLQPEQTNDKDGKRVIVSIDQIRRVATFRLKFVNGSKGAWLHIGIHHFKQPDKCLLKSPPIKVQTNRSKRPRDSRRKPIPIVSSLSPSTVPSVGNFPGRKDRMLLIFGSNFYLWGNSPVVLIKYANSETAIEIRPPNLIWWSENLLECQLPECNQDIEVKVANYDMIFGEGKTLRVFKVGEEDHVATLATMATKMMPATLSQLVLEYTPSDTVEDLSTTAKVVLHTDKGSNDRLQVQTSQGEEIIPSNKISAVIRIFNRSNNEKLLEVVRRADVFTPHSMLFHFSWNFPNKPVARSDSIVISAFLQKDGGQVLVNASKGVLSSEKPLFGSKLSKTNDSNSEDDEDSQESQPSQANLPLNVSQVITAPVPPTPAVMPAAVGPTVIVRNVTPSAEDLANAHQSILTAIRKCDSVVKLNEWEGMLNEALRELREQRQKCIVLPAQRNAPPIKLDSVPTSITPQPSLESMKIERPSSAQKVDKNIDLDDDDDEPMAKRGKLAPNESRQEVSLAIPDPKQKNGVVYWKFFNPGNRTFLELTEGKLQIIGSRRIQMLIESVPANSKFINAHLYVQKNDQFEVIEYCSRCKENGIPNVFCVLPRRGREHDFPWITFRITCTSTAKHWKGSLFWIGAEFLVDPTQGSLMKVFSPPIHVQSKVKGKDLLNSSSGSIERVSSKENMRLDTPSPSQSPSPLMRTGSIPNNLNGASPSTPTSSSSPLERLLSRENVKLLAPVLSSNSLTQSNTQPNAASILQPQAHAQIQLHALAAAAQLHNQGTASQSTVSQSTASTTATTTSTQAAPTAATSLATALSSKTALLSNSTALSAIISMMSTNATSQPSEIENSASPQTPPPSQLQTSPVKT